MFGKNLLMLIFQPNWKCKKFQTWCFVDKINAMKVLHLMDTSSADIGNLKKLKTEHLKLHLEKKVQYLTSLNFLQWF